MRIAFGYGPPKKKAQRTLCLEIAQKLIWFQRCFAYIFWKKLCGLLLSQKYGFIQSDVDSCLFIQSDCILVTNLDDCLCFSNGKAVLDLVVHLLFCDDVMTDEGEVATYLGVDVKRSLD